MQKIFVIEDDENIRNLVKIAMEGYGYQVAAFETAEEALEELEKENPADPGTAGQSEKYSDHCADGEGQGI